MMLYYVIQWVITDARHDSTANTYHTAVPCLSGRFSSVVILENYAVYLISQIASLCSTKHILGISILSRVEHATARTREPECTEMVLQSVINGLC